MNPAKARQVVVASIGSTLAIVVVAEAMGPDNTTKLSMRTIAGLGFGFLFLSVTADFAPQVAAPLSVLVLLTALVVPAPGQTESAGSILLRSVTGKPRSVQVPGQPDPSITGGRAGPAFPGSANN